MNLLLKITSSSFTSFRSLYAYTVMNFRGLMKLVKIDANSLEHVIKNKKNKII
jgi:hypothetical protein